MDTPNNALHGPINGHWIVIFHCNRHNSCELLFMGCAQGAQAVSQIKCVCWADIDGLSIWLWLCQHQWSNFISDFAFGTRSSTDTKHKLWANVAAALLSRRTVCFFLEKITVKFSLGENSRKITSVWHITSRRNAFCHHALNGLHIIFQTVHKKEWNTQLSL